jgi:hypothetical protein
MLACSADPVVGYSPENKHDQCCTSKYYSCIVSKVVMLWSAPPSILKDRFDELGIHFNKHYVPIIIETSAKGSTLTEDKDTIIETLHLSIKFLDLGKYITF